MTHILKSPFGTFRGHKSDGIIQYRGLKYASLKDQLSVPELVTTYPSDIINATQFGLCAPAIDGCAFEQSTLIQCSIGVPDDVPRMSGTECLNLNITVPEIGSYKLLPVMVFVHGGGLIMGANYWPQYDASRLVKMAGEVGMPVIVVSFNYRLGVLGNLSSKELREAGYPGNNSLRDQKCALQWIKRHIGHFGGDTENIMAFGESAGAACVLYQLHSKEPLFKRCVSMSGTPIMLKPLSLDVAETVYTSIMKELGLEDASAEKRIQRLKTIEPDELVKKTPMSLPFLPILDGDIVPEHTTFAKLAKNVRSVPGMKWCEELMIGDSQHDGNVFVFMGLAQLKVGIASALTISLHTNLPASAADAVLQAYDICPTMEDDAAMDLILRLATDIGYVAPAVAYAQSFPGKTYYYQFNEPNTWDGPFKGNSTHMLDAAFLFQNFNEHMSKEPKMIAKDLATDFVKFSNGIKPWVEHDMGKKLARVFGPSNKSRLRMAENNGWGDGRRDVLWKLNKEDKVDLDKLSVAWDMFIAGR